jgi:ATP-dependent RNA helicase RhlE
MGRYEPAFPTGTGCVCFSLHDRYDQQGEKPARHEAARHDSAARRISPPVLSFKKSMVARVAPRSDFMRRAEARPHRKEFELTNEINTGIDIEATGFAKLGISGVLLKATHGAGFTEPKPIQEQAIPPHLAGRDILGVAQTGSGKTAAFALPILSKIIALGTRRRPKTARALILAPTRELAVQIDETIRVLARGAHISTALVLGGVSRSSQVRKIAPGVDFLIATPGRLTDLVRERDVNLSETTWLVLDEADRMLDMGFINDVRRLAKATHPGRQTALFSATMPPEIEELANGLLRDPARIAVAPQGTTVAEITQSIVMARTKQKRKLLSDMLADPAYERVIVFARTKHGADRVTRDLARDGFEAAVIHGNKSQNARQGALNGFRDGKVRILVATDIAARGIDVPGISHVINFDLPDEAESYVHRIGRTARNGASGTAVTLVDPSENAKLRQVERIIRMKLPVTASYLDQPDPALKNAADRQIAANDDARDAEHSRRQGRGRSNSGQRQGHRGQGGQAKPQQPRVEHGRGVPYRELRDGQQGEQRQRGADGQRPAANTTKPGEHRHAAGKPAGKKRFRNKRRGLGNSATRAA